MTMICDCKTERLNEAIGLDVKHPRFSWKYSADTANLLQMDYRVKVYENDERFIWDSGKIKSQDMCIRYGGPSLMPATDYTWRLETTLSDGKVLKGKADFSTGLLDRDDLKRANWIAFNPVEGREVIPAFRKEFCVRKPIRSAHLFSVGCGVYEVYLNGSPACHKGRVSFEMKPGFTESFVRKFYHSFDVTDAIQENNCLSAIVTGGWWSDRTVGFVGRTQCFKAVLLISYEDGTEETLQTDETWKVSTAHPIQSCDIYSGETYDARIPMSFTKFGFSDTDWNFAKVCHAFDGTVESMHGVPVQIRKDLSRIPERIYTYCGIKDETDTQHGEVDNVACCRNDGFLLKKGQTAIVDFGQNAAGREEFAVRGKAGTRVVLRHGEMLNDRKGEFSRGNDGAGGSLYVANLRKASATTTYIIGKDDETERYSPTFTFYGFRYLSVTADDDVYLSQIKMQVLTSVSYDSGHIVTGNSLVNRLFENGRWGMYSNYLSIPTDCPQRDERAGWTADTQVFATTALYYSTAAQTFLEKWIQDLRDSQASDGRYPSVAPRGRFGKELGTVGWSDAGILTPFYVYSVTGDDTVIRDHYHSMKRYMDDFLLRRKNMGPEPRFGDWLSFEENSDELQEYLCACFYAFDATLMSRMAEVIGRVDDALLYQTVYERQKNYIIERYMNENGSVKLTQQTAALYALWLDLYTDEESKIAIVRQLKENILGKGTRLQTGFLGTAILLPTLSKIGENELAYSLLLQDAMPSWLYSVKAGATTIWERWNSYSVENGFGDVKMNSFNHYAYGCVNEWLFSNAAGIRPITAGFQEFWIAPIPDRRLGHLQAEYDSVQGKICSSWEYKGDVLQIRCSIPCNTTAHFRNPLTGEVSVLASGNYEFCWKV